VIRKSFFILLFVQTIAFSQFEYDEYNHEQNKSFSNNIKTDAILSFNTSLELLQSPFFFDKNDMLLTGVVLAIAGASFSFDNKIRNEAINSHNPTLDKITNIGENFGRPIYGSILGGLLYTAGLFTSNNHMKTTGQMLAEAILTNGIYTQLFKLTLGRARPFTGEPYTEIDPFEFEFESEENSLPSGHTSTAFTVATVLSERIDNIYASVALYSLASLTAYQRVYTDVHWFSDTILGAALGTFIGLKIVKLHEKNLAKNDKFNLNIYPQITSTSYGVGFAFEF
jgi:membrane-associated phospholipid phosphatase